MTKAKAKPKRKPKAKAKPKPQAKPKAKAKAKPKTAAKSTIPTKQLPPPQAAPPTSLLRNLLWQLGSRRFATPADLVASVRDYYSQLEIECTWQPDELVLPIRELDLRFEAFVVETHRDTVFAAIRSDDPRGFTAAQLLWHIHETLAGYDLGDHKFFEGVSLVQTPAERGTPRPLYRVSQGS